MSTLTPSTTDGSSLPKLRHVPITKRAALLAQMAALSDEDLEALQDGLTLEQAGHMVENVVATYALPFAIATNFIVNGREVLVPMVVEESSVVAACSLAAKLAWKDGGFTAGSDAPIMIGQVQVLDIPDMSAAQRRLLDVKDELIDWLNARNASTISRHARAIDLQLRVLMLTPDKPMLVAHILYDCGNAMGANLVNTACESLAPRIELLTGGRVNLRILSNLSDRRRAWASCVIPAEVLGADVAGDIVEASQFAEIDPYRAATHNKGVMNGIDAVAVATGNDWRAVEAGAHAYAASEGRYTTLSRWRINESGDLAGEIKLPLAVGIVGGATRVHPAAQVALKVMGVKTARELAEIMACVGLAQNLAALRALATEGIQRGHMSLHARQIAVAAGATGDMIERIALQLISEGNVRMERAKQILNGT